MSFLSKLQDIKKLKWWHSLIWILLSCCTWPLFARHTYAGLLLMPLLWFLVFFALVLENVYAQKQAANMQMTSKDVEGVILRSLFVFGLGLFYSIFLLVAIKILDKSKIATPEFYVELTLVEMLMKSPLASWFPTLIVLIYLAATEVSLQV